MIAAEAGEGMASAVRASSVHMASFPTVCSYFTSSAGAMLGSGRGLALELAQAGTHALALGEQLRFQGGDLVAAAAHQVELVADVAECLVEDLAAAHRVGDAAVPLAAQGGAGVLSFDQLLQSLQ